MLMAANGRARRMALFSDVPDSVRAVHVTVPSVIVSPSFTGHTGSVAAVVPSTVHS